MDSKTSQSNGGVAIDTKLREYEAEFVKNEELTGVRPVIREYGRFLRGHERSNMSGKWQGLGIPVRGNNYWTCAPAIQDGSSGRFDPENGLYQSWFGVYTQVGRNGIRFGMRNGEPDMEALKRLAEADQFIWLSAFGDSRPVAHLTFLEKNGRIKANNDDVWIYYGEISSHSDVGHGSEAAEDTYGTVRRMRFVLDGNPADRIGHRFFIPNPSVWETRVNAYHEINLKGYFGIIPTKRSVVCIYVNGAEFTDTKGRHHDTWPSLRGEAIELIRGVKVERLAED